MAVVMPHMVADRMQMNDARFAVGGGGHHQMVVLGLGFGSEGFRRDQRDLGDAGGGLFSQEQARQIGGRSELVENGGVDFDIRPSPDHDLRLGQARASHADGQHHRQGPIPTPFSAHRLPRQRFGVITATQ
jgi:hypothetical protein